MMMIRKKSTVENDKMNLLRHMKDINQKLADSEFEAKEAWQNIAMNSSQAASQELYNKDRLEELEQHIERSNVAMKNIAQKKSQTYTSFFSDMKTFAA